MIEENSSMLSEEKDLILSWVQDPDLLTQVIEESRGQFMPENNHEDRLRALDYAAQSPSKSQLLFLKELLVRNDEQEHNMNNVRNCITQIEQFHEWIKDRFEELPITRSNLRTNGLDDLLKIVNLRVAKMSQMLPGSGQGRGI